MTKYAFRLQRVQRVRAVEEELARARFGEAETAARLAEERTEDRRRAIDVAIDDLRGLQGSPTLAPTSVIAALGLVEEARTAWRAAEDAARNLRLAAEDARRAWMERRRDLEGLDRLDERSRAEFLQERDRLETLALDEVASQRNARNRRADAARNAASHVDSPRPSAGAPHTVHDQQG